jgi:hypothetical protein
MRHSLQSTHIATLPQTQSAPLVARAALPDLFFRDQIYVNTFLPSNAFIHE